MAIFTNLLGFLFFWYQVRTREARHIVLSFLLGSSFDVFVSTTFASFIRRVEVIYCWCLCLGWVPFEVSRFLFGWDASFTGRFFK